MSQWNDIHNAIKAIQKRVGEEFKTEITDEVLRQAIRGLIEFRLSDYLTAEFETFATKELLIASQILDIDERVMKQASEDRAHVKKRKGDLN